MQDPTSGDFDVYCPYCGADYDIADGFYCECMEEDDDDCED